MVWFKMTPMAKSIGTADDADQFFLIVAFFFVRMTFRQLPVFSFFPAYHHGQQLLPHDSMEAQIF